MAYFELDPNSGFYRICFRFPPPNGKRYKRSREHKIKDEQRADAVCGIVQETIRDLMRGFITVPEGVDPGDFILSGGKLTTKPVVAPPPKALTLQGLLDQYAVSGAAKEDSTRRTERTHFKHLLRILGANSVVDHLEKKDIQGYVDRRANETYKYTGQKTKPQTIKKELGTLSVVWTWARDAGEVKAGPTTQKLRFPKGEEKLPFRTRTECERAITRAGLARPNKLTTSQKQKAGEIWESLFLTEDEITAVLEYARDWLIHPMLAFAAYTGARRSEMCRAEVEDVNFDTGMVQIREKKRDTSKTVTFRHVPLHDDLRQIMGTYLAQHLGGNDLFCGRGNGNLTWNMATKRFRSTFKDSEWQVLHGWHTFRHSFASNLARRGVPQPHIDELMGHETEAMRKRYRHLFPQDLAESVGRLFSRVHRRDVAPYVLASISSRSSMSRSATASVRVRSPNNPMYSVSVHQR